MSPQGKFVQGLFDLSFTCTLILKIPKPIEGWTKDEGATSLKK
jgi:hypothetical protein